jgi:hypothetical protein
MTYLKVMELTVELQGVISRNFILSYELFLHVHHNDTNYVRYTLTNENYTGTLLLIIMNYISSLE